MHYECEGCGRELKEEHCLQYAHIKPRDGNKATLVFCPRSFYGNEQNIWCLENALYAMCLAMDKDKLSQETLINLETEIHELFGGRRPIKTGAYTSLTNLKQALQAKINLDYEKRELNEINGERLAEGDYLTPSPWLGGRLRGRAIKEIEINTENT